jgi:predicted component of type VI protein secretion system
MDMLEVETRDGLQRVPLDKPRLTIGRLPGNDIVLPFTQISRHHAEIRQRGEDWWIIDIGSTNGMRIGGQVVKEHRLRSGDRVVLAPTISVRYVSDRTSQRVAATARAATPPPQPAAPSPERSSAARDPAPSTPSPAAMASAGATPLPRRRMDVVPPPDDRHFGDAMALPAMPSPPSAPPVDGTMPIDSPFGIIRQHRHPNGPPTGPLPRRAVLISCPSCQASTAPDGPYCWKCHQTIARPCAHCGVFLLPVQARCPRCHAANPHAIRHSRR